MKIQIALLPLFFSSIFGNEMLIEEQKDILLKNVTQEFQDFKAFALKKFGELEFQAFNLEEENSILRQRIQAFEHNGDTPIMKNLMSDTFDYLYTRIVEIMSHVNDFKEIAYTFCSK